MEVFSRTPEDVTNDTVLHLKTMLATIEADPNLLLEVVLQGPFAWRQKVRRTSAALFMAVDDNVLNLCFKRLELILHRDLNQRAQAIAAMHGRSLTKEKALDLAIQDHGTDLHEAQTARDDEAKLFEAAAEPRPGLTLEHFAETLPAYPDNAGLAVDKAKL